MVEVYLRNSEAYEHTKNSKSYKMFGLDPKSSTQKVPQIRLSFNQNTVVSPISGHRWCKDICLLIGGVRFLENIRFLYFDLTAKILECS